MAIGNSMLSRSHGGTSPNHYRNITYRRVGSRAGVGRSDHECGWRAATEQMFLVVGVGSTLSKSEIGTGNGFATGSRNQNNPVRTRLAFVGTPLPIPPS